MVSVLLDTEEYVLEPLFLLIKDATLMYCIAGTATVCGSNSDAKVGFHTMTVHMQQEMAVAA